jgi:putative membrane protein
MPANHLSPLSVPYRVFQRGGSIVAALVFALATGGFSLSMFGLAGPLLVVAVAGAVTSLVVLYEVAYYRRFTYELTADTLDVDSGVLARRNREIPLRRIQNVDISRNVLQRALGISDVSFETAGGSGTEARFRYVSFEEAKRLQREIARLKRGETMEEAAAAATQELFALSDRELALLGAFSFDFRLPGVVFVFASGSVPFVTSLFPDSLAPFLAFVGLAGVALVVVLVSWVAGAAVAVVNYYGFRLVRASDELQYERGLLQRYDGSIPFDKVQTLTIEDNPLKRWAGYASLSIETAGYSPGQSDGGRSRGSEAAIPLATRDRVDALVEDVEHVGTADFERPPKRTRRRYAARYLIVLGAVTGLFYGVGLVVGNLPWYATAVALPVVPVAAHYKWKHRGYWLGENHVVTRNGVLSRETKVVPYYRIQTVIDTRTIFQRRLGLATVTVDTAGSLSLGGQDAAAVDVDAETADRLREELGDRLRVAVVEYQRGRLGIGVTNEVSVATETADPGDATGRPDRDDGRVDDEMNGETVDDEMDGETVDDEMDGETVDETADDETDADDPFVWGENREDG